ncbi:creatininase family protein [Trujillonella humicola]|uniref:creatininase family protein n=1 Tax=Trujillonella humicola TaxID=3383699 RepID=UPI0039064B00
MATRLLTELTAPALAEALRPDSVLVLPTGAIEQHGPHLPVATDLITAQSLAERAVERFGDELDLWLLPPLAYTKSNEHAWSAGTFWLSAHTLTAVLRDLGRSVAATPARRLAFLNGHGGNSALLQVVARDIRVETGLATFTLHPRPPVDQGGTSPAGELGMGVHGGFEETSLMLHLRPDLVDMGKAGRWVPEHLAGYRHVRFGGSVAFGWTSDDFGPDGVIGDARGATAEDGARRAEQAVAYLGEALGEVARFDPAPPTAAGGWAAPRGRTASSRVDPLVPPTTGDTDRAREVTVRERPRGTVGP